MDVQVSPSFSDYEALVTATPSLIIPANGVVVARLPVIADQCDVTFAAYAGNSTIDAVIVGTNQAPGYEVPDILRLLLNMYGASLPASGSLTYSLPAYAGRVWLTVSTPTTQQFSVEILHRDASNSLIGVTELPGAQNEYTTGGLSVHQQLALPALQNVIQINNHTSSATPMRAAVVAID